MWITGTILAGAFAALLVLNTVPVAWIDDVVFDAVAGVAGFVGLLGWAQWTRLEREMLAALGWRGEESRAIPR